MTKKELENRIKQLETVLDILWEYISEKDINEISIKVNKIDD